MFNINIGNEYRVYTTSGSKGSQIKYLKDNLWYKEDNLGYEGVIESLVSLVLKYSSMPTGSYVIYDSGLINDKNGCRSKDFTSNGLYCYYTLQKLYNQITGLDLYTKVKSIDEFESRRDFVLDFFNKYYNYDLYNYFSKIFTLDLITLNEDRHFNNLGVLISSDGSISDAPIFDNGMSLLNGNYSVNRNFDIEDNTRRVTSKPFSGSPLRQYSLFSHSFYIDYIGLFKDLSNFKLSDKFYKDVLEFQLMKYKSKFFKYKLYNLVYNNNFVGTRIKTCKGIYDTSLVVKNVKNNVYLFYDTTKNKYLSKFELDSNIEVKEVDKILVSNLL